ncbi:hypothetical protein G9A89_017450 [Geosiphon pyriformis]|nr:hypothetical protein G9A89_017450 [Geosiphon pyriformis]
MLRLLVTVVDILWMAVVDILLVAVVDKLGSDILVLDKLAAVSLAGKCFNFALDFDIDSRFGIGDQGFDVNFLIVSYKCCSWLLCGLVYYSCGRHTSLAVTADWMMTIKVTDFGNDSHFPDCYTIEEVHRPFGLRLVIVVAAVAIVVAVVVAEVVLVAVEFTDLVVEMAAEWVQLSDQLVGD